MKRALLAAFVLGAVTPPVLVWAYERWWLDGPTSRWSIEYLPGAAGER